VILAEIRHYLVFFGIFARGLGAIFNGACSQGIHDIGQTVFRSRDLYHDIGQNHDKQNPKGLMISGKLFSGLGLHASLGFMVQGLGFNRSENACGFKDQGSMLTRSENGPSPQK
jgi:hypothetical protein